MTVRPTPSGDTPRPGIGRTGRAPAGGVPARAGEAPAPAAASGARRDEIQISSAARELARQDAAGRNAGAELSADRMQQVLQRLADGHYDRPDVRDEVLRRLAPDLS